MDNKLYSQSPDIFTGDKQKARKFITQWDLYWSLNFNTAMLRTPYTRAMLFLTFFNGPLTANWTSVMNHHLNTQVRSGVPVNDEALWDHVYDSFRRQYADMQEQERAEDTLQRGINMRPGELDAYIAEYEVLVKLAGYDPYSRLTLKIFTDGLPTELYKDVLRLDQPRNYTEWKEAALTHHTEWVHFKHHSEQKQGVKLFNPFKPQYQPPRDPNSMDTSADRTRARQIEAEAEGEHARVYAPKGEDPNQERPRGRQPPFPPRASFLKKRWEQKDKRGVQCYNCQKYRHITKECFQQRKPRTPQSGPSTQARRTHQGEESNDEAKEQANVILWQMGEASDRVKGYCMWRELYVTTPPVVGPTWLRVRSTLGSDCLPVLSQGTVSLRLRTDCLHCYRAHPMSRDWGCTSTSYRLLRIPVSSMRP